MDGDRFDALARSLGTGLTRRGVPRLAAAAVATLSVLGLLPDPAEEAHGASRSKRSRHAAHDHDHGTKRAGSRGRGDNHHATHGDQIGSEKKRHKKHKKKCKVPRVKCGKHCCDAGSTCDQGQCSLLRPCPTCGSCETCYFSADDGTMTCLNGCPESCTDATMCQAAAHEDFYRQLASHLANQGFAPTRDAQAHLLREPGEPDVLLLTTTYAGPGGASAELAYAEVDGGRRSFFALIADKDGLGRIFYVDAHGAIVEQPPVTEPPDVTSSKHHPRTARSGVLCYQVLSNVTVCDGLCAAVIGLGCSTLGKIKAAARCASIGPEGPALCGAVIVVVCDMSVGSTVSCPTLCDALDCPKDKCNGVDCPPGMRCLEQQGGTKACRCVSDCCKDSDCHHADLVCNKAGVCVCGHGLKSCPDGRCHACCEKSDCTDLFGQCGICDAATGTCTSTCPLGTTCEGSQCRDCTKCETPVLQYNVPTCAPKQDCCLTPCDKCHECKGRPAECVSKACPKGKECQASTGQCVCKPVPCPNGVVDPNTCTCNSTCASKPCKTPPCTPECYYGTYAPCGAAAVDRFLAASAECGEVHDSCNKDCQDEYEGCERTCPICDCEAWRDLCTDDCHDAWSRCKDAASAQEDRDLCACEQLYPCCSEGLICP
jgi:hypothetical protein